MLRELLAEIEKSNGCVSVPALSRALNAQPSAVAGMVQTLVQRGRLLAVESDAPCAACGIANECALAAFRSTRYVVAPAQALTQPQPQPQ